MSERLRGVSFDWWGTLYVHRDARTRRLQVLRDTLQGQGCERARQQVETAYDVAMKRMDVEWRSGRVYHPSAWLADLLAELELELPQPACRHLQGEVEEALLATPPILVAGAADLLAELRRAGARIGLISDTGLTVGRAMRRILEGDGILGYFDAFAFSDEVGVYKPDRLAFETVLGQLGLKPEEAVHVGDLPETDICGAKALGLRAVLITGVSHRQDDGQADAVVEGFAELGRLFRRWGLLPDA